MNPNLAGDPYLTKDVRNIRQVIRYLERKIRKEHRGLILDVGQRSPLTDAIDGYFPYSYISNTEGDLDIEFRIPTKYYDVIVYSHTIEHQHNPLYTLLKIKDVMLTRGRMFIILPSRPHFLREKQHHYHEIDRHAMKLLIESAGMRIMSYERQKHWRYWKQYLKGFRPLCRLFFEFNAYYEVWK